MNNTSRYIANLFIVALNVRDTLEFTLQREHKAATFQARKKALEEALNPNSAFKNFLDQNGDKGKEIQGKYETFIKDIYGDDNNIFTVSGEELRVDHTQHIKIYDYVVGLNETLRDILISYLRYAKEHNENEEIMEKLVVSDEALYRSVANKLILQDFEKSFVEFNKVMSESKGQPTPQSNFIAQNELAKYASYLRFIRGHIHLIDNKTLDMFDEVLELLEMSEGRRERRDGKSFNDLFKHCFEQLDAYIKEAEVAFKDCYRPVVEDMVKFSEELKAKQNGEQDQRKDN